MAENDVNKLNVDELGVNPCEQKLRDIETLFGLYITIHDQKGLLHFPDGSLIFEKRALHQNPYCLFDRYKKPEYDKKCIAHCRDKIELMSVHTPSPMLSTCWKGVKEIIVPIYQEETLMFILYAGAYKEVGFKLQQANSALKKQRELYNELPNFDLNKGKLISRSLESAGAFILNFADSMQTLSEMDNRKVFIKRFILRHAHEGLSLKQLADALFLSASRTSHLVQETFGQSFKEMLVQERIKRSKVLLVSSPSSLASIAIKVGFKNEFYFGRMFKKYTQTSPGKYRKENANITL